MSRTGSIAGSKPGPDPDIHLAVTIFLLIGAVFLLLMPVSAPEHNRALKAWWDFAHVPGFAFLVWRLMTTAQMFEFRARKKIIVFVVTIIAVPMLEAAQYFSGRELSCADVVHGWIGCLSGALFYAGSQSKKITGRLCGLAAIVVFALSAVFPIQVIMDRQRCLRSFPLLSSFDSPREKNRWVLTGCEVTDQDGWLVTLKGDSAYASLFLDEFKRDWRSVSNLVAEVHLRGDSPVEMWIRVDDRTGEPSYQNRFQEIYSLVPGDNRITVSGNILARTSGGRPMNMTNIVRIGCFFDRRFAGRAIEFKRLYLEIGDSNLTNPL
jgi:hypothetical protein